MTIQDIILAHAESEAPYDMTVVDYLRCIKEMQFGHRRPEVVIVTRLHVSHEEGGIWGLCAKSNPHFYFPFDYIND